MNKKAIFIIIFIILIALALGIWEVTGNRRNKTTKNADIENPSKAQEFLITGYPENEIPLYKPTKISSSKIRVNNDPKNSTYFNGANFAYFNLVYETSATQSEFLNYYRNLFDKPFEAGYTDLETTARGIIGAYNVSAVHYGTDNTGYIEVYLASHTDARLDQYFNDFPEILVPESDLVEHERTYGLLNQKGGEVEYTKYYTVIDSGDQDNDGKNDKDEFTILETKYLQQFAAERNFQNTNGTFTWNKNDYQITLSISRDHGRIYLMIRKPYN